MLHKKTVLVFGTFDRLHDGHRFFLREARKLFSPSPLSKGGNEGGCGLRLLAVVAQDSIVKELKGKLPREPLPKRLATLLASGLVNEAVPADTALGHFSAVTKYRPDVIALGYDQAELAEALRIFITKSQLPITLITLPAHAPTRLHSRLLRN